MRKISNKFCFITLPQVQVTLDVLDNFMQSYIQQICEYLQDEPILGPFYVHARHLEERGESKHDADQGNHVHLFMQFKHSHEWTKRAVRDYIHTITASLFGVLQAVNLCDKVASRFSTQNLLTYLLHHDNADPFYYPSREDIDQQLIDSQNGHRPRQTVKKLLEPLISSTNSQDRFEYLMTLSVNEFLNATKAYKEIQPYLEERLPQEVQEDPFFGDLPDVDLSTVPESWKELFRWLRQELIQRRPNEYDRQEWPHLYIYGDPAIGKTKLFNTLRRHCMPVYVTSAVDPNYDGYDSKYHRFIQFDEFMGLGRSGPDMNRFSTFLKLMSTSEFKPMRKWERQVPSFDPRTVIFISNDLWSPMTMGVSPTQSKAWFSRLKVINLRSDLCPYDLSDLGLVLSLIYNVD